MILGCLDIFSTHAVTDSPWRSISLCKMFVSELESGEMVKKDSKEANGKFRGFPTFVNKENGLYHSGLPQSKSFLYKKLGYEKENYSSSLTSDKPTLFCGDEVKNPLYIIINDSHKNTKYHVIGFNGKKAAYKALKPEPSTSTSCSSSGQTLYTTVKGTKNATYVKPISSKEFNIDLIDELKMYFPCMSISDWKNLSNIDIRKLRPASSCNNLPGMFSCNPTTDCAKYQERPKHDYTRYILYGVIGILILVILFLILSKT